MGIGAATAQECMARARPERSGEGQRASTVRATEALSPGPPSAQPTVQPREAVGAARKAAPYFSAGYGHCTVHSAPCTVHCAAGGWADGARGRRGGPWARAERRARATPAPPARSASGAPAASRLHGPQRWQVLSSRARVDALDGRAQLALDVRDVHRDLVEERAAPRGEPSRSGRPCCRAPAVARSRAPALHSARPSGRAPWTSP
jgi:hypothetical protein